MVAAAYALRYRDGVRALVFGEATVPGTSAYDELKTSPPMYHFAFHSQLDLPEALVAGREEVYLQHFFDRSATGRPRSTPPTTCGPTPRRVPCAPARPLPRLRAGRRGQPRRAARGGRLSGPVLAFCGEVSGLGEVIEDMARDLAEDVRVATVPQSGHRVAEENPAGVATMLTRFLHERTETGRA